MKKSYGLIALALLLAAAPAFAQDGTIGVYFNTQGTQTSLTRNGGWEEGPVTAYVIAFFENVVGGAAYQLTISDPGIMVSQEVIPPGIEVGNILTGCEIGLTVPQFGFYGKPVLLETLTLLTGANIIPMASLTIGPWVGRYDTVLLADHLGTLYPATGLVSYLSQPVASEHSTWGGVKDLYK